MMSSQDAAWARAQAVRLRGTAMPPEGLPAALIQDSWVRCMQAGLDVTAALQVPVTTGSDLAHRRERSEFVRRLAQAELESLGQQIAGSNFLLAFADPDGVILDLFADNRFAMSSGDAGIVAGSCWAEKLAGTNGLGTALATGQAVAVTGLEHYFLRLGNVSCTAAPVRNAAGELVGALDASSYFDSRQHHTQALVQMAATHIENGLLVHQMRSHTVLAIHSRTEYLSTWSAGLVAVDETGTLCALNARAASLLAGLQAARGATFESLFGEPLERLFTRLQIGPEAALRTVLGRNLVANLVAWPATRASHRGQDQDPGRPAHRVQGRALELPADLSAAARVGPLPQPTAGWVAGAVVGVAVPGSAFVTADPEVAEACRLASAAVALGVPVLIQGETGTGKELLARHAHAGSGRRGSFVAVNCAALPRELFEAELFGYVGGAYTGSRREGSAGLIASADGGCLLLDEVQDLPLSLQAALLRFLDDSQVRPVGGQVSRRVDVQILAATNAALDERVAGGLFRADLLYRLNVVRVTLPPLRRRKDFAQAVLASLRSVHAHAEISAAAVERMGQHAWPGNFRELRAVLTRALLSLRGPHTATPSLDWSEVHAVLPAAAERPSNALQQSATELIRSAFERCGRCVSRTSRALGVSRTTVYRHLRVTPPR